MKILYSIQATGNGHISRAMEMMPYLKKYGEVDLFLSGSNSSLKLEERVKFRSRGLCYFYDSRGGLDYWKTIRRFSPLEIIREARDLPVEKYDLVINDFECITALACRIKKKKSIHFGHHASFQSENTPRPKQKEIVGEWILRHFGRASSYIGLHFKSYDKFIHPPIIKKTIRDAVPSDLGHITVYLPSYCDQQVFQQLCSIRDYSFEVFSAEVRGPEKAGNFLFIPVDKKAFNQSLIGCHGIITCAGFETPAEALYLGKKLLVIPTLGQYEQNCNAAALEEMGVKSIHSLDSRFASEFKSWLNDKKKVSRGSCSSTEEIIEFLIQQSLHLEDPD
jgi:uncharacterized protein (TIGR00661 family)